MFRVCAAASAAAISVKLCQSPEQMTRRKRPVLQLAPQRDAVDEFGRDESLTLEFLKLVDRGDSAVFELPRHPGFPLETFAARRIL